jgi:hypothetical protein
VGHLFGYGTYIYTWANVIGVWQLWKQQMWSINHQPNFTTIRVIGHYLMCCNPSLRFVTKAKACKGADQKWSPWVTFHVPRNVGECEGMNVHTPKWAPTLGVGVLMDFQIFKVWLQTHCIEKFLISLEISWNVVIKMGLHDPFG